MNRKKLLILNTVVVLMTTVVNIVFGMVEVHLLISKYGSSVNGLVQTGNQFLTYLSLIEAGISASFLYSLYKPIANSDSEKISSLYLGFKNSLNKVVLRMAIVAGAISFIYPAFLKNDNLSYWFMVSIFFLLSAKAILPYFVVYVPKYMIIAKEQRYKSELISCISKAITYGVEIILMIHTSAPLQILLCACVVVSVLSGLLYRQVMLKLYAGLLVNNCVPDFSPKRMSRDVLAHNLSTLVFNSTDNIILSVFCSLNVVTVYSNYTLIVNQVIVIFQSVFDGVTASLGIKIANNDSNSYSVYRKLFAFTQLTGSIICVVFIVLINDFIELWVGKEYCIGRLNCYLFGYILFCGILLPCIQSARNARGLYKESRNFTIFQSILNLVITVALTPFIGLTGALLGTFIARMLISVPFNFFLVEKKVFPEHHSKWFELPIIYIIILLISFLETKLLDAFNMHFYVSQYFIAFVLNAILVTMITSVIMIVVVGIINPDFKVSDLFNMIKGKRKNG